MTGAVPLLSLYAFMVWQGTSLHLPVPLILLCNYARAVLKSVC